jgi:uncharacterized membrane protein YgcG
LELAKLTVTGSINTIIMMAMNVLYVLAVLYVESTLLITMSQITLAVAKLYWNNIAIWQILKKCKKELHKCWKLDRNSFKWITTEDVFAIAIMIFFNNIIAPCISIMLVNPSCFYHAFAPAPSVHSTYTYCSRYFRFARHQDVCFGTSTGESSYDPAFFYSYNCASTMPWNYAAVYIYMMLISGVLIPIGQLTGKYIYDHLNEDSLLFKYLDKTLPRFWRKLRPLEEFVIKVKVKSRKQNVNATQGPGQGQTQGQPQVGRGSEMETLKGRETEGLKTGAVAPSSSSSSSKSSWFSWLPWISSKSSVGSGSTETTPTASFSSSPPTSFSSGGRSSGGTVVGTGSIANAGEVEMLPLRHSKIMNAGQGANQEKEEVIVQGEKKFRVKYPQILHKGKIIVRLMGFFAILVSFGVIFPPLAAMSCVTIAFWSYFLQVHVGRVLVEAKALQYTHYIVQLYRDCDHIVNLIIPTILPLMFITSMLLGFLVFDTIGDAEGHRVATAPALFLVIFPAVIWLFGKVNWNEVYRRIYWTVHSWIFIMDPDMMARLKALQLERDLQAQEEDEAERLMQEREQSMLLASADRNSQISLISPSMARASTSMMRPSMASPLKPIQSTMGGRASYFMNKTVVDVDDGSDSEEEEEEEEEEHEEENDVEGVSGDAGVVENTSNVESEGSTNNPLHTLV